MNDATPATSEPGLKGEVSTLELDRLERMVARRSAESRATIPTMEFSCIVEISLLMARVTEIGCGLAAAVIAAVANALRAVARVNGAYRDGRYELYSRVNVGVTMVGEGIHATPTILDADGKSAAELGRELAGYYERARAGELHSSELTGATFTVVDSTVGEVATVTPIVLPPQAGSLAFGLVRDVPVVRDGEVVPGRTMQLSLAVDHRIVYGHHAAAFLAEIKAFLEEARL